MFSTPAKRVAKNRHSIISCVFHCDCSYLQSASHHHITSTASKMAVLSLCDV
jgi:hypothetical protein